MKRPEWAGAGTFDLAWREAARAAQSSTDPWHRSLNSTVLGGLQLAHVITVGREQVAALPYTYDTYADSAAAFRNVRLPFEPLYLSLDAVPMTRFTPAIELLGALVGIPEYDKLMPHWDGQQPMVCPVLRVPGDSGCSIQGYAFAGETGWVNSNVIDALLESHPEVFDGVDVTEKTLEDNRSTSVDAAEIVAAVVYFLESSNIELVEAPVTRQERRSAQRRGGRIAWTVEIRAPKKRPATEPTGHRPDWSHRWEVRGHYKHFPAGTKLADSKPEKLVSHSTLGQCRRIWCPPHVKGPESRPLVPKVRTTFPTKPAETVK